MAVVCSSHTSFTAIYSLVALLVGIRLAIHRLRLHVLPGHHFTMSLDRLLSPVPLSLSSITWYQSKSGDTLRLGR